VDNEQRKVGKVGVLACGFQGSIGAFQKMAPNYGVKVSDELAGEIVERWRAANPNIVQYWRDLENAAYAAVKYPGGVFKAGPKDHREIQFRVAGSFLWCRLPSGRCLCYPFPQLKDIVTPWGAVKEAVTYMGTDSKIGSPTYGKWTRLPSYGGKWAENITQAVSRDILVSGMFNVEALGYPIVLHVHDENVSEVRKDFGSVAEYEAAMCRLPKWGEGLPVAAKGWRGERYRK
jgi:DNA polymerase